MKVNIDGLHAGWANIRISDRDSVILEDSFSYTPYDSFGDLLAALISLHDDSQINFDKVVTFNAEPVEYDFHFKKSQDSILLSITEFDDLKRIQGSGVKRFEKSGNFDQLGMPFWRALRNLQSQHSAEELDQLWHRGFPSNLLMELTRRLMSGV